MARRPLSVGNHGQDVNDFNVFNSNELHSRMHYCFTFSTYLVAIRWAPVE